MRKYTMELLPPSPLHKMLFTLFLLWWCDHKQLLFSSPRSWRPAAVRSCSPPPATHGRESSKGADCSPAHSITLTQGQGHMLVFVLIIYSYWCFCNMKVCFELAFISERTNMSSAFLWNCVAWCFGHKSNTGGADPPLPVWKSLLMYSWAL